MKNVHLNKLWWIFLSPLSIWWGVRFSDFHYLNPHLDVESKSNVSLQESIVWLHAVPNQGTWNLESQGWLENWHHYWENPMISAFKGRHSWRRSRVWKMICIPQRHFSGKRGIRKTICIPHRQNSGRRGLWQTICISRRQFKGRRQVWENMHSSKTF